MNLRLLLVHAGVTPVNWWHQWRWEEVKAR